jgi:hypothetical protein
MYWEELLADFDGRTQYNSQGNRVGGSISFYWRFCALKGCRKVRQLKIDHHAEALTRGNWDGGVGQIPDVKFRLRRFSTARRLSVNMNAISDRADKVRLVTTFGESQLVRHINGRYELIGGTADDHAEAREWCSIFAQDVVFTTTPRALHPIGLAAEFAALRAA